MRFRTRKSGTAAFVLAFALAFAFAFAAAPAHAKDDGMGMAKQIEVVEHPGYFETKTNVMNLPAGEYEFVVTNKAGKEAGFVVKNDEGEQVAMFMVEQNKTARKKVDLDPGTYSYYCPLIPTPHYQITVK